MVKFLPDPMSTEEWLALVRISNDRNVDGMRPEVRQRLELLGYAQKFEGGLLITDEGLMQIGFGSAKHTG